MNYVYVLQSEKNQKRYVGQTCDIARRLNEHNSGKVQSTKAYRPYRLIYYEECGDRNEAIKRERYLKSGYGFFGTI